MSTERIKEAITVLRAVHAHEGSYEHDRFDYGRWISHMGDCGTVACAGGFLCLYQPFREQGLTFDIGTNAPRYEGYLGTGALQRFLGIGKDEAYTAFAALDETLDISFREVTAAHVADYLETLL